MLFSQMNVISPYNHQHDRFCTLYTWRVVQPMRSFHLLTVMH